MAIKRKASKASGLSPRKHKRTKIKDTVDDAVSGDTVETSQKRSKDSYTGITSFLKDDSWLAVLGSEFQKPYFKNLEKKLEQKYKEGKTIFPPRHLIFDALIRTPLNKVKVVILGQDPYRSNDQATGLSFSVPRGIKVPPSLMNIYKELVRDPEIPRFKEPDHGCLEKWAKDGVLLLDAALTVEVDNYRHKSHAWFGWHKFTDHLIRTLSARVEPTVFILMGFTARKKKKFIDKSKHKVILTAHPSPKSYSKIFKFYGCGCFSECNKFLKEKGQTPIDWSL